MTKEQVKGSPGLLRAIKRDLIGGKKVYFSRRICTAIRDALSDTMFNVDIVVGREFDKSGGKYYLKMDNKL